MSDINHLFDTNILNDLDLSEYGCDFKDDFSHLNPEEGFITRSLNDQDFEKGLLLLCHFIKLKLFTIE